MTKSSSASLGMRRFDVPSPHLRPARPASPTVALRNVVAAWERLPGPGKYTNREVQRWLTNELAPAIKAARITLGLPTEPPPLIDRNEDDTDQGFSSLADGCNVWPCHKVKLVKSPNHLGQGLYWKCPQCGGFYGEVQRTRKGKRK